MKRSQVNRYIEQALETFAKHKLYLPKWASWPMDKWGQIGTEADEVRTNGLGWIVTDFGSDAFDKSGLLLFVIRNGLLKDGKPTTTKTYAEKAMIARPGQVTPFHFHWHKTEDLINRGGGRLEVQLGWAAKDEKSMEDKDVLVQLDGVTRKLKKGEILTLEPGESVTLPPRLCHWFRGHAGDEPVLVGEVSSLNDDGVDNCFLQSFQSAPLVEDEAARFYLRGEFPQAKSTGCCSHAH